ncbi:hypothetical protein [Terasakiella sp.]|uniref:hypothetical protein n=1 Tax=Terasakiella sp. TaxID=2034861 RepID=UPI003AA99639
MVRNSVSEIANQVSDQVLLYLYNVFADIDSDDESIRGEELNEMLEGVPERFFRLACELLLEDDLIEISDASWLSITKDGIELVETWSDERYEAANKNLMIAPASDRIVSLSHNSQPYADALGALEEVYEGIRSKNDLDISGGEKETCLVAVKTIQTVMSQETVTESIFQEFIVPKLRWIAEKCADKTIDALIGAAITAVLALSTL